MTRPPHGHQPPRGVDGLVLLDEPYRTPDQTPMLRPSITIRVEYRQLGTGPDSIEVEWEDGTTIPSAADICQVIAALVGARP